MCGKEEAAVALLRRVVESEANFLALQGNELANWFPSFLAALLSFALSFVLHFGRLALLPMLARGCRCLVALTHLQAQRGREKTSPSSPHPPKQTAMHP